MHHARRHSVGNGACRHVAGYDRARANDGALADTHAWQNSDMRADPCLVLDYHWGETHRLRFHGKTSRRAMIGVGNIAIRPDHHVAADVQLFEGASCSD